MSRTQSGPHAADTGAAQNTSDTSQDIKPQSERQPRRRLSDILAGNTDEIREQWDRTEAAADFVPLPAGQYECHVQSGELFTAKSGTPGYKLAFRVLDGEHAGRQVWHDLWLTPAALPMSKRDLGKLGVTALEQLETPLPSGRIRCKVRVALRTDDGGEHFNRVRGFDVLVIDEPEADPFAPADDAEDAPPEADAGDASFKFGANVEPAQEGGAP